MHLVSSAIASVLWIFMGCNEMPLANKPERDGMAGMKVEEFFAESASLEMGRAIADNNLNGIKKLTSGENAVELNSIHMKDMTFLHFAFVHKNVEAMKLLIESGASPHIEIKDLGSVMGIAVGAKDVKYLKALLESGVSANSTDRWEMPHFFAATTKDDDCKTLELFAKHGADFDIPSSTGRTAIMHAFSSLAYDHVEYLIKHGVKLDSQTSNGVTLAYFLELELEQQKRDPNTAAYKKLIQLRDLMKERGVKFPATHPSKLRSQLQ